MGAGHWLVFHAHGDRILHQNSDTILSFLRILIAPARTAAERFFH